MHYVLSNGWITDWIGFQGGSNNLSEIRYIKKMKSTILENLFEEKNNDYTIYISVRLTN